MRSNIYFDERQLRRRRRILKLKIYGGILAFFVLVIGAGYLIVYSPLFRIKNISIQSLGVQPSNISRQFLEIEPLLINELKNFFANQSKIAQFLGSDNILIWKEGNTDGILKNYPQIAEIAIKKDYLERQIKIEVKEREKFGIWCTTRTNTDFTRNNTDLTRTNTDFTRTNTDQTLTNTDFILTNTDTQYKFVSSQYGFVCWWFDKNGISFDEAPAVEGNLINKVDDFSGQPLKIGESVLKENLFSNLVKIFEVLEKSDLKIKSLKLERPELQEIIADSPGNLLPKIYFSLRIDPGFGVAAIESLKNTGLEKIEYIDLRVENRAYYRLK